ncbi:MAG: hypothetical protein LUE17_05660 [Planctomycetaceae bacterium]|nr:hypothetical protein [Planctomycetaceae bacterium]
MPDLDVAELAAFDHFAVAAELLVREDFDFHGAVRFGFDDFLELQPAFMARVVLGRAVSDGDVDVGGIGGAAKREKAHECEQRGFLHTILL